MRPKSDYRTFRNLFLLAEVFMLVFFYPVVVAYQRGDVVGVVFFGLICLSLLLTSLYFHIIAYFEKVREERGEVTP